MNEKKSITNIPLPVLSLSRTLRRKEENAKFMPVVSDCESEKKKSKQTLNPLSSPNPRPETSHPPLRTPKI